MTCVYICGLHLNNDSLRVGEEGVETGMEMERVEGCQEEREVRRHPLALKKKKKNDVLILS